MILMTIIMIFIIAGALLGLSVFGLASMGTLLVIGFKIGIGLVPFMLGVWLIRRALGI